MVHAYQRKSRRSEHELGNLEKAANEVEDGKSIRSSAERYGVNRMELSFC